MFLDFFHLREQPFGVTPDPAYLYPTRTHCEALDSLTDAILEDRGFLALIAEPGMGKTTLLYQLLDGLRDSARAAYLFQTQCNSREFFQYLLSELGVDSASMGLVAMHNKLNEMLFAEMLAGKRFVLIVDEAQNLDDSVLETIRLLSNFETPHTKLLQIVLAGQPQLGEKLGQTHLAQLLQRITVVKHLEALSPEETAGYVRHRLKVAGRGAEPLFDPDALVLLAERSQGIPRIINKICFRALLEAYARGHQTISPDIIEKAYQKLDVATVARSKPLPLPPPAPVALPAPSLASTPTDSAETTCVPTTLRLSYKPLAGSGLPGWGLWASALVAVLLTAGLALPRNLRSEMMQAIRNQVTATKSLVQRVNADDAQKMLRLQESAAGRESVQPPLNQRGLPFVTAIQASGTQSDAQVVVMLDGAVQYDSARIASPDRIYFDLYKAQLGAFVSQKTVPADVGLLKGVRAAQNTDGVVRLVLDADGAKDYSAQLLSNPYRLVIDVHTQPLAVSNHDLRSDPAGHNGDNSPLEASANHESQPSLARELGLKINRIAIDPGHGGYDTGTTGPHGLLEKTLCLDVALRLGQLIEQNIPNAQVVYTRKDDRHVPLEERTAIANGANADLFISIHANSSESRAIRGVETYYLSLAASPAARELATRENALAESSLHDLPDLIMRITRNDKVAESKLLALDIQNTLSERLQLVSRRETNRGVKQAPFIVLTGANMPAVLSEISFVSNATDESLLLESAQRQRVAEGLYRGIAAYLDSLHSLPHNDQKLFREIRPSSSSGVATAKAPIGGHSR